MGKIIKLYKSLKNISNFIPHILSIVLRLVTIDNLNFGSITIHPIWFGPFTIWYTKFQLLI